LLVFTVAPSVQAHGGLQETSATHQQIDTIQSRSDAEIARRLSKLNQLSAVISGDTRLSASDKNMLTSQVAGEISDLTSLRSKIAADTDLGTTRIDAQSIYTEYRVYALIVPKMWLVRTANDQSVVEAKLNTLIGKLQTRINSAAAKGKDIAALQSALNDMSTQVKAAQAISSAVAPKVLPLQPTDFNNDHTILSGYLAQLKTAHAANKAAANDAKTIVQDLKN
jgi:hypothetical protein